MVQYEIGQEKPGENILEVYLVKTSKGVDIKVSPKGCEDSYHIIRLSTSGELILYEGIPKELGLECDEEGKIITISESEE